MLKPNWHQSHMTFMESEKYFPKTLKCGNAERFREAPCQ